MLGNIEHDDNANELEVEITDLDPIDENSAFDSIRLAGHVLFTKIHWKQARFSVQRTLFLCMILVVPLIITAYYNTYTRSILARECIYEQPKIVFVANETVTSSGTTINVVAVPVPSTYYAQKGSITKVASNTCK